MVRRLTNEEVIQKFIDVHGDRYNYSNVEYVNNSINVTIICRNHGSFQQSPASHFRGNGCSSCSGKQQGTTNDFLDKVKETYGDEYDLSLIEYKNANTKVKVICRVHGEFKQLPNNLLKGHACPLCTERRKENMETFLKRVS